LENWYRIVPWYYINLDLLEVRELCKAKMLCHVYFSWPVFFDVPNDIRKDIPVSPEEYLREGM